LVLVDYQQEMFDAIRAEASAGLGSRTARGLSGGRTPARSRGDIAQEAMTSLMVEAEDERISLEPSDVGFGGVLPGDLEAPPQH
jgi:hypothetical protein